MARIRRSIQELDYLYTSGQDRESLKKFLKAFAALQAKPASDPDSFFVIGGYHGEPLRRPEHELPDGTKWWGGYCVHENVLFPTWHRAYMLRIEDAMRRVPGCEDVTLCYWDECADLKNPLPNILTTPTLTIDGEIMRNPLYSYKLVQAIKDQFSRDPVTKELDDRYTKPKNYETMRFPLSGLVGSDKYRADSALWNAKFTDPKRRGTILNGNVANWLNTGLHTGNPPANTDVPKGLAAIAAYGRFVACLQTKDYTIFSNTTSQKENAEKKASPDVPGNPLLVSVESPHNSMHLALGGFFQPGRYLADPEDFWKDGRGANGDMGANEMAGLDPIFFLHHAFIDYVFCLWQKKHNCTARGSIKIDPKSKGANTGAFAQPGIGPNTPLTIHTPLRPFLKPGRTGSSDSDYYTSDDLVDFEHELGYTYSPGSLDGRVNDELRPEFGGPLEAGEDGPTGSSNLAKMLQADDINLNDYPGSFVIRTYATTPSNVVYEVGREAVLSRWSLEGCGNCRNRANITSLTPISKDLADFLREGEENSYKDIQYSLKIQQSYSPSLSSPDQLLGAPEHKLVDILEQ